MSASRRFATSLKRLKCADIVEKLESPRRSQSRRPLAGSMEISLGAQRSDRSFCVRPSLRPRCGNYPCREHYARGSRIFAVPQFPTFSTVYAHCRRPWRRPRKPAFLPTLRDHVNWVLTSVFRHSGARCGSSARRGALAVCGRHPMVGHTQLLKAGLGRSSIDPNVRMLTDRGL